MNKSIEESKQEAIAMAVDITRLVGKGDWQNARLESLMLSMEINRLLFASRQKINLEASN